MSNQNLPLPKYYKGPFYGSGHIGNIFMKTKQGDTTVLDIRGWGYLTGGGSLKLPEDKAAEIQDQFEDWVINALNQALEVKPAEDEWTETPPTEPGHYWLYGDEEYGGMGGHYSGAIPPDKELYYVHVSRISNGLMGVSSGRFISLKKFDREKRIAGHIGAWKKVTHPTLPNG